MPVPWGESSLFLAAGPREPSPGELTPGYRQLEGVDPSSQRETFVAIKTAVENERWRGVPFFLVTGKALAEKKSEVVVRFRSLSAQLSQKLMTLDPALARELEGRLDVPATLRLEIDPRPGVWLEIEGRSLELVADRAGIELMDPYERLFYEAVLGDQSFFVRSDEIEVMWERADPFQVAWNTAAAAPVVPYRAGVAMPAEAVALMGGAAQPPLARNEGPRPNEVTRPSRALRPAPPYSTRSAPSPIAEASLGARPEKG